MDTTRASYPESTLRDKLESTHTVELTEEEFKTLLASAHSTLYVTTVDQIKEKP